MQGDGNSGANTSMSAASYLALPLESAVRFLNGLAASLTNAKMDIPQCRAGISGR